jgi:hypothetical protein
VTVEAYERALARFTFQRLYIVSDMETWGRITPADVRPWTKRHWEGSAPDTLKVPVADSVAYVNQLVEGLGRSDPVFRHTTLEEDFRFIRSFDKILVFNSTFSWWAAALSEADHVGVFGPCKPRKAGGRNKNLGRTDFPGWFQWGDTSDLLIPDANLPFVEARVRRAAAGGLRRLLQW